MLDRPSAWPHFQHLRSSDVLKSALEAYTEEQGHPKQRMPTLANLISTGREDLVRAIKAAGLTYKSLLCQAGEIVFTSIAADTYGTELLLEAQPLLCSKDAVTSSANLLESLPRSGKF